MMKRKRHSHTLWKAAAALTCLAILFSCCWFILPKLSQTIAGSRFSQDREDGIYSRCAVLMDVDSGKILFEKNAGEKVYPASLTKIMKALIALEENKDLNRRVILDSGMFHQLTQENASLAGFEPGEMPKLIDLIYGALLPSGAEAAVCLAETTAGDQKKFISLMNRKAVELKLSGTKFTNVTGLHSQNHYTTAKDVAKLLRYALKNEKFREAFLSSRYTVAPTNLHPQGFTFHSTLSDKLGESRLSKGELLGGKTGYTNQAGLCLASLADYNGQEHILVTLGAQGSPETPQYHIMDALTLYPRYWQS